MNADESNFCAWTAQVQSITPEWGKSVKVCGCRAPDGMRAGHLKWKQAITNVIRWICAHCHFCVSNRRINNQPLLQQSLWLVVAGRDRCYCTNDINDGCDLFGRPFSQQTFWLVMAGKRTVVTNNVYPWLYPFMCPSKSCQWVYNLVHLYMRKCIYMYVYIDTYTVYVLKTVLKMFHLSLKRSLHFQLTGGESQALKPCVGVSSQSR